MFHVSSRKNQYRRVPCIKRKTEAYLVSATLLGLSLWSVIFNCFCKSYCNSTVKYPFRRKSYYYKKQGCLNESYVIHVIRSLKKYENETLQKKEHNVRPMHRNDIKVWNCDNSDSTKEGEKIRNYSMSSRLKIGNKLNRHNCTVLERSAKLNKETFDFKMTAHKTSQPKKPNAVILQNIIENPMRRLPQAIIVGVKKSGTRALLEYLRLHPDIRAPGPEPHFFDRHYHLGLSWYRNKMPSTIEGQITIEKTPRYFVMPEVPSRISAMSKDVKLIIVVRDPVNRAISDFTQGSSKDPNVTETFVAKAFHANGSGGVHKNWSTLKTGIYVKHVKRWLNYFSLRQMHFVSGENLIANPAAEVQNVTDFLNLRRVISDKYFYFNETKGFPCLKKREGSPDIKCFDKSKGRPHPHVEEIYIERLRKFYRPYNEEFYRLVGTNFRWF